MINYRLYILDTEGSFGVGNAYAYPDPRSQDDMAYPCRTFGYVDDGIESVIGQPVGQLHSFVKSITLHKRTFVGKLTIEDGVVTGINTETETATYPHWRDKVPPSCRVKTREQKIMEANRREGR